MYNDDTIVLNEMYFGKLPGLLKIEDFLTKLQQKYRKSNVIQNDRVYREMIKDPILHKIGYELSDIFGFKEVMVTIARDDSFNAYTIPFVVDPKGNSYDVRERKLPPERLRGSVIIDKNGFRFDKKKFPVNLLVCINLGCFYGTSKVTMPELLAVLLHEVGHNFSKVIMSHKLTGRADESFADQFSASYGYGPEFNSAFSKIAIRYSDMEKAMLKVPIVNVLVGINQIMNGYLTYNGEDPHPNTYYRMNRVIKQLEADLRDTPNLTPTMRKDIQDQIEQCKRIVDQTYTSPEDAPSGDRMTKYYYREIEPNYTEEVYGNKEADKYSSPTKINQTIGGMYKKVGWYRRG